MASTASLLKDLEAAVRRFGPGAAPHKLVLLRALLGRRLARASQVLRLHDALCYLRALPDDAEVLAVVEDGLASFGDRQDLATFRDELEDSGMAGTVIRFPFDAATAQWLAARWPGHLRIDWPRVENDDRLMERLYLLALDAETPGLDNAKASPRAWLDRMRGPGETDAEFVAKRFAQLPWPLFLRGWMHDDTNLPLRLEPGPDTPTRTHARLPGGRVVMQTRPLAGRPDLRRAARRGPRELRRLSSREGAAVVDLTRAAMATRARYLDAFSDADPDDVTLADAGGGLAFAVIGVRPEGRMLLETVHGWLMLRNRVPIGYVLSSAFLGCSEIAFNLFPTWRGGDAAWIYGRAVATARALYGSDTFSVDPYQLGHENAEGLASGAWRFYQKLGFRPRDPDTVALMHEELARIAKDRAHRSSRTTLRRLAREPMYLSLGRAQRNANEVLAGVGLAATRLLATRYGADRERGERACVREATERYGVRSRARWTAGEKLMWRRWSPILVLLAEREEWSRAEAAAVVRVVRAKGAAREWDYVDALRDQPGLQRALMALARS
ncbi:MAG: hypothetical protein AAGD14_02450 [Planctomycetota bacterium]